MATTMIVSDASEIQSPVRSVPADTGRAVAQRTAAGSMAELLYMAVEKGTPVAELKELVALHEHMSERQSQQDFAAAMAAFQAECPSIRKSSTAKFAMRSGTDMSYTFAALDQIAKTVNPILAKHGLSYNWDATVTVGSLTCVCTVRHANGFSTSSSITLPTDSASAMSSQQKIGSALTFARRLSLTSALGLTSTDDDVDGREMGTAINDDQVTVLDDLIAETKVNRAKFLKFLGVAALSDLPTTKYNAAVTALEKKRGAQP